MHKKAVIFDLDGVIVSTDELHYQAWKSIADELNILFDRSINERLRGVSRMESFDIILSGGQMVYSETEKLYYAEKKNDIYKKLLESISEKDIMVGVMPLITSLKEKAVKVAIGSSSKNARFILKQLKITAYFDAIVDGTDITKSKPDPEVFLKAAKALDLQPHQCVVVEDAKSGIDAAIRAGMRAVGVGAAALYDLADIKLKVLSEDLLETIIE